MSSTNQPISQKLQDTKKPIHTIVSETLFQSRRINSASSTLTAVTSSMRSQSLTYLSGPLLRMACPSSLRCSYFVLLQLNQLQADCSSCSCARASALVPAAVVLSLLLLLPQNSSLYVNPASLEYKQRLTAVASGEYTGSEDVQLMG